MSLTYANVILQLQDAVNLLEKTEVYATTASTGFIALEDAMRANTLGDYANIVLDGTNRLRSQLASCLTPEMVRTVLAGPLIEFGDTISAPERSLGPALMKRIYDYMHTNSYSLKAREFTRGAASAGGSNVGSGSVFRCTSDFRNYPLEASHAEVKTLLCVQDQRQVDVHEEVFECRGADRCRDYMEDTGSGLIVPIRCLSARDSQSLLRNPTFGTYGGTSQPTTGVPVTPSSTTAITGWTLDDVTSVTVGIDSPAVYRELLGESVPKWVRFAVNRYMYQVINDNTRAKMRTDVPYHFQIAVRREGSCDGTLTIAVGAVSRAVTMTALTNDVWTVIAVPSTPSYDCWYDRIHENDLDVRITLASRTTGSVYLHEIVWAPYTPVDGAYIAMVGGATPFMRDDTFTITDTAATRGIMQYWISYRSGLADGVNFYGLPSTTGTETVADPT